MTADDADGTDEICASRFRPSNVLLVVIRVVPLFWKTILLTNNEFGLLAKVKNINDPCYGLTLSISIGGLTEDVLVVALSDQRSQYIILVMGNKHPTSQQI